MITAAAVRHLTWPVAAAARRPAPPGTPRPRVGRSCLTARSLDVRVTRAQSEHGNRSTTDRRRHTVDIDLSDIAARELALDAMFAGCNKTWLIESLIDWLGAGTDWEREQIMLRLSAIVRTAP